MKDFFICVGEKVLYKENECIITRVLDLNTISIEEINTGIPHTVKIKEVISPNADISINKTNDYTSLTDSDWKLAKERYEIIKPILEAKKRFKVILEIVEAKKISKATLYRWVKQFESTNLISSLANRERSGGKGKSRLTKEQDLLIKDSIEEHYLNASKTSIKKVIRKVKEKCYENDITPPHENTIRNRIKSISAELKLKRRYGHKEAMYKYEPHKGKFPGADNPLSVVQVDHTLLDIILVDEQYRNPYKRPWLSIAIDVFSRMVLGFYLSFESPGAHGTGLCLSHAILPKDNWLKKMDLFDIDWPCWGFMRTLHFDNAKEFRGTMVEKACLEYNINIEFRPPGKPHYGGHVERLLGTFSKDIHDLPGTTFDKIEKRKNYDSKKKASLTLTELEKWLTIYITKIYHLQIHSGINMSPLQKYQEAILGDDEKLGIGLPSRGINERKVKLDFMPYIERSIQEYGVVIDHIYYYDDVMRKYIHSRQNNNPKSPKRKFLFRRDPRDLSKIYFFDPELQEYFDIPYRNTSLPPISIWEYKDITRKLSKEKVIINEDIIFNAYREIDQIADKSVRETRMQKKSSIKEINIESKTPKNLENTEFDFNNITPFDDDE